MRTLVLVLAVVATACGPQEDQPSSPPSFVQGGSVDSRDAGGAAADAGVPDLAKRVWEAQAKHWDIAKHVRDTDCEYAIDWVRLASKTAGQVVRAGTVHIDANDVATYTPGGSTLKLSKPGWSAELEIVDLVGDPRFSFPTGDTAHLDVKWRFASGGWLRCDLRSSRWSIIGDASDLEGNAIGVELLSVSVVSAATVDFTTNAAGTVTLSGQIRWSSARAIDFTVQELFAMCLGSGCGNTRTADYSFDHNVALDLDGQRWELDYTDGYLQETSVSPKSRYWAGRITGPQSGGLVTRQQNSAWALDVLVGSSRHTVEFVSSVAP